MRAMIAANDDRPSFHLLRHPGAERGPQSADMLFILRASNVEAGNSIEACVDHGPCGLSLNDSNIVLGKEPDQLAAGCRCSALEQQPVHGLDRVRTLSTLPCPQPDFLDQLRDMPRVCDTVSGARQDDRQPEVSGDLPQRCGQPIEGIHALEHVSASHRLQPRFPSAIQPVRLGRGEVARIPELMRILDRRTAKNGEHPKHEQDHRGANAQGEQRRAHAGTAVLRLATAHAVEHVAQVTFCG